MKQRRTCGLLLVRLGGDGSDFCSFRCLLLEEDLCCASPEIPNEILCSSFQPCVCYPTALSASLPLETRRVSSDKQGDKRTGPGSTAGLYHVSQVSLFVSVATSAPPEKAPGELRSTSRLGLTDRLSIINLLQTFLFGCLPNEYQQAICMLEISD